uniref:F-box domain-containing protein n=1 Tax=Globodera pallida TaxID=36090 RepID=A0A183CDB7_GLOPA
MSDNVSDEEQQQQLQEIICADVWLEVFAFVSPVKLAFILALISDRFDALVDVHFKSRKWSLGWLHIHRARRGNRAQIVNRSGRRLPIPQGPLPNKVTGFEKIEISYVDQTVIKFLQRIRRLFDSSETNVAFYTFDDQSRRSWKIIWQKIWPLVNDNIGRLSVDSSELGRLRQFSPTILRDCAKLRLIDSMKLLPAFPADDNAGASSRQAVAKWLLTSREDGLPKMCFDRFHHSGKRILHGLKGSFVNASEPANFIMQIAENDYFVPFELKNNWTGERLTFRRLDVLTWLLVRCPIVREEAKWAAWEKEAIEWEGEPERNCINIDFEDSQIGDGMLDENDEGPSEPKK